MVENKKSFTFVVLSYNHEKYIVEHLESIKFLLEKYSRYIDVDIVVSDDFSTDKTRELISFWLECHGFIFRNVVKIYNEKNLGTCKSVLNAISVVETDALKITAGDDVYSYENIFDYVFLEGGCAIRSGIPLSLIDGVVNENKVDVLNIIASQVIYKNRPLIDRFSCLSNNNAPNIIYNKKYLIDEKVCLFLRDFDVVEDWPIQIGIASNYPTKKFDLIHKVFVYYRRTPGSIYIVASSRFHKDKVKCYFSLMKLAKSRFRLAFLSNRLYLFKKGSRILNKLINLSFYEYVFSLFSNFHLVVYDYLKFESNCKLHQKHYDHIKIQSNKFVSSFLLAGEGDGE